MKQKKNILIVGAGFSGATIARKLAESNYNITVIDSREHIAGNAYDFIDKDNIRIHKYGPHIFHTNNKRVVNFLSNFTQWTEYKHKVKAILGDGIYVTLPPNKETAKIVGKEKIIDTFFRPYTKKMWGLDIEDLDPSILKRVPVRDDDNELYFPNDSFQMLPSEGYTKLIENILDHKNINVSLSCPFEKKYEKKFDHIFNSMPIDEYFNFKYGELPYRSIKFKTISLPTPRVLPVPTVNFTNTGKYTRVTEWKLYPNHGKSGLLTKLTFEEPCDYKDNNFERYYPVKDINGKNREIYEKYKSIKKEKITFIGRCGQYVYIDMDQAVSGALSLSYRFLKNQ